MSDNFAAQPEAEDQHNPETAFSNYEMILAEYQRRQMITHLTGPIVSLVFHVMVIFAAVFLINPNAEERLQEIEVTIEEMEIKEIEPKVLEKLEQLEQVVEEVVPSVTRPDVPTEAVTDVVSTDDFSDNMAQTDDAMDFSEVLDIKPRSTALRVSGMLGGRSAEGRRAGLRRHGGSAATEDAVLRALRWLKRNQNDNGSWAPSQPQAMTGLALLCFLAHGETPLSEEFGVTVQKAIRYLVNEVMNARGEVGSRGYPHGIVSYALAEAYAMTQLPIIKPAMEKALTVIVEGQQQGGGYDYSYRKGDRWDLSVASWQFQAMKAGQIAGADVPGLNEAVDKGIGFCKNTAYKDGWFGYSSPGSGSQAMAAAGALVLQLLGEGKSPEVTRTVEKLQSRQINWKQLSSHGAGSYWMYYHTQAMFHAGGKVWNDWNNHFTPIVLKNQAADGHWPDFEENGQPKGGYYPVYNTTLVCLMLTV